MRGLNIAKEIRREVPSSEILFFTKNAAAKEICEDDFRMVIETDPEAMSHWPAVVRSFSPDLIVYDTLLPEGGAETWGEGSSPVRARTVYVMRKSKKEKQEEIFANPFLRQVDLIVVPHTPEEFGEEIPPAFRSKSFFVGPIVRLPRLEKGEALRRKYEIKEDDFLLVSTAGGGGFEEKAASFFEAVFKIHRRVVSHRLSLRHLVILGPNFKRERSGEPGGETGVEAGLTVVDYEPDLVDLFSISDLVIAEGGYNTVNEIRLAKTPAVFLPSDRKYDDQEERVRGLAASGLAFVFPDRSAPDFLEEIVKIVSSDRLLEGIRRKYEIDRMEIGNISAAKKIVALVRE